jgi:F-type H+-transporting ATPase subunit c
MKKIFIVFVFTLLAIAVQAQEVNAAIDMTSNKGLAAIGAGIAVLGAGIGIGVIGFSALLAISRQPEVSGEIRSNLIVAAALIEGVAFFALIVCMLVVVL